MTDIFISTASDHLASWSEAFPHAKLSSSIQFFDLDETDGLVFWLHQNAPSDLLSDNQERREQWLGAIMRLLVEQHPSAKVIVLSNTPNQVESLAALRQGALGYCHAYTAPKLLKQIREVIMQGGVWLGQEVLQRLIKDATAVVANKPEYVDTLLDKLTKREREVALHAGQGLSNKEIARQLKITERTIKAHLAKTFEKLGAKDRLHLALMLNNKQE